MATPTPTEVSYSQAHLNDDRIPTIIAVDTLLLSVASIAVILRFVSRSIVKSALRADDWMIVVGLVRIRESYCLSSLTRSLDIFRSGGSTAIGPHPRWIRTSRKLR